MYHKNGIVKVYVQSDWQETNNPLYTNGDLALTATTHSEKGLHWCQCPTSYSSYYIWPPLEGA